MNNFTIHNSSLSSLEIDTILSFALNQNRLKPSVVINLSLSSLVSKNFNNIKSFSSYYNWLLKFISNNYPFWILFRESEIDFHNKVFIPFSLFFLFLSFYSLKIKISF